MPDDSRRISVTGSRIQARCLNETVAGYDVVELTGHAIEQMKIRQIDESDILATLRNPTETGLQTQPGRKRVRRTKTARVAVDVVYEEVGKRIRVITVIKVERRMVERRKR